MQSKEGRSEILVGRRTERRTEASGKEVMGK
jgi:hypothetical protein